MDMFDCVIPTRYARSATLFTSRGKLRLTHRRYRRDFFPVDAACDCYCCRNFTRAYLHHLYNANEILSAILAAIHNVRFYLNMMEGARIEEGDLPMQPSAPVCKEEEESKNPGPRSKRPNQDMDQG
jgi:queuine tRNA-ribosyltransferase